MHFLRTCDLIRLTEDLGEGEPLPREFRVFRAGWNVTSQGALLFDEKASASVLSAFGARGVDVTIDLQHDSVDEKARAYRNDAGDARGYCRLEDREGELWAVDVRWTPDGEARLRDRRQKYISPIVLYDPDSLRVRSIFNLALVSQPATYHAQALVASRHGVSMDPDKVKAALEALKAGDGDAAMGLLESFIAEAASGGGDASPEPGADAPADASAESADPPPKEDEDESAEAAAMLRAVAKHLRVDAPSEVLGTVKSLSDRVRAIEIEREASEHAERLDLVGELVKLGAELPSTAWSGDPEQRVPAASLKALSLSALRDRVEAFRRAAADRPERVRPPRHDAVAALSASDQERADRISDPDAKARFVALRLAHGANQ